MAKACLPPTGFRIFGGWIGGRHGYEAEAKPKLWSKCKSEAEAKALTFWKHEAEAEALALAFSKHEAEAGAEAQVLPSYYKYPFSPLITCHLLKFRQNIQANMIWKWKILSFSSFETTKPEVKFWICEVTKPKLSPSHEAEAEAEALNFRNHEAEAEAEAEALASNASASWSRSWSRSSFVPMSDCLPFYEISQPYTFTESHDEWKHFW